MSIGSFCGIRNKRNLLVRMLLVLAVAGPVFDVVACDHSSAFSGSGGEGKGGGGSSLMVIFIGNAKGLDPMTSDAQFDEAGALSIEPADVGCLRFLTVSGSVCATDGTLGHHF